MVTEDLLNAIVDPFEYCHVIHGTYYKSVGMIMKSGLNRMARNHVHMAMGVPGSGVISGMRATCEVVVEVNMVRASRCDVPFF